MSDSTTSPTKIDISATHVYREWKHTAPLIGCRWDPTGRYVLASGMDNTVQRWDLETDEHTSIAAHDGWMRAIGFSPDGKFTYTAGYDGRLCYWETSSEQLQPIVRVEAHDGWIRWLAVHPDGKMLATAGNDRLVKLWSTETGDLLNTLTSHDKHVYSLLFHPQGRLILSGDLHGVVHAWEVTTGRRLRSFEAKALYSYHGGQQVDYGGVRCMALSHDGKELACGGLHKGTNPFAGVQEPLVLVFDWESGKQLRTHEATDIDRGIVWRLQYQQDGTLLGASGGGSGGYLLFWRNEKKTQHHKFRLPNTILDMDVHANRRDVVTAHHDGRVRLTRMAPKAS